MDVVVVLLLVTGGAMIGRGIDMTVSLLSLALWPKEASRGHVFSLLEIFEMN